MVRALVEHLFEDPAVTRIQTDPSPDNGRAIRCDEKADFRAVRVVDTPDGPAPHMVCERALKACGAPQSFLLFMGDVMKRALHIVAGIVVFAALGFALGSLLTGWYADHLAGSDADINTSVGVFLLLWAPFAALGGYLADRWYRGRLVAFRSQR